MKKKTLLQEENYIIGIDLGYETATICFLDHYTMKPVLYDMSGGYGRSQLPIIMEYNPSEGDWLIGDHTMLEEWDPPHILVDQIMFRLKKGETIKIGEQVLAMADLLLILIQKILVSFSLLNPHATIDLLVIAVPEEIDEVFGSELEELWGHQLGQPLTIISDLEAFFYTLKEQDTSPNEPTCLVQLDYNGMKVINCTKNNTYVSLSEEFYYPNCSVSKVEEGIKNAIKEIFLEHQGQAEYRKDEERQMELLFRQYLPMIFQKYAQDKSTKIYFNFPYPPFQKVLSSKVISEIVTPLVEDVKEVINERAIKCQGRMIPFGQGLKYSFILECFSDYDVVLQQKPHEAVAMGCVYYALLEMSEQEKFSFEKESEILGNEYQVRLHSHDDKEAKYLTLGIDQSETILIIDFEESRKAILELLHKKPHTSLELICSFPLERPLEQKEARILLQMDLKAPQDTKIVYLPL